MNPAAFEEARDAARALIEGVPALATFAPWPADAVLRAGAPVSVPARAQFLADKSEVAPDATRFLAAARAVAHDVEWRRSYTGEQVGEAMVERYGWFELVGPRGHFHSAQGRVFLAYFGPGLRYPWHWHEAEEIYYVVAGGAEFEAEGRAPRHLGPGDACVHLSNQPHAMTTHDVPLITLALWRGAGLAGYPVLPEGAR